MIRLFASVSLTVVTLCAFAFPANSDEKTKEQDDMKLLQGDWICVMEEIKGKPYSKDRIKELNKRMNIDKDRINIKRVTAGKQGVYEGKFEIDQTSKPKKFDFIGKFNGTKIVEWRGIYELDKDKFKLMFVEQGLRPKVFSTSETGVMVEFKRDKE